MPAPLASALRRFGRVVKLGVALIHHEQEVVFARETQRLLDVVDRRDGALRIAGAAQIEQRRALQRFFRDRVEIGQKTGRLGRGEVDGLRTRHHRGGVVDLIEGIGHQRDRLLAVLGAVHGKLRHDEQAFAGTRHRRDLRFDIDQITRQRIAPVEPGFDRRAQFERADHRRVAVPLVGMVGDDLHREFRRLTLRVADRHGDGRDIDLGRDVGDQRGEPREGIVL